MTKAATPLLVGAGACVAVALAWWSVSANFERACTVDDTPYLALCGKPKAGSPDQMTDLRARLAANPGDAGALVQLAFFDQSGNRPKLIGAAAGLAPGNPNIMAMQAAAAWGRQDWPVAVPLLVQLAEYDNNTDAALALARLIAAGRGALVSPYLTPGSAWLARSLHRMPELHAPFAAVLPLVVEGFQKGVLDLETVRSYIRALKAAGGWVDAYGLWLGLNGRPLPLLYNASFDQPFQPDGFDWEVAIDPPSHAGALIERLPAGDRGSVLAIQFTGRSISVPMVRQYVFLGEGRYRLGGEYMARQLRMENGMAWAVTCTSGKVQAGQSGALGDTGGKWQSFGFEFTIPSGCGIVASLQLMTFAPFEATIGARGRAEFDALTLVKLPPP